MSLTDKIKANTAALHHSYNVLNDGQLHFKSAENCWSILECLEHIYLIDKAVLGALTASSNENMPGNEKTELFGEEKLNKLLVNGRAFKVPAPDYVKPKGQFTTLSEAAQHIDTITNKVIEYIASNPVEQETQTFKHPVLGQMTRTDWIHFLVSHTQRHIHQIEDLRANSNFPA